MATRPQSLLKPYALPARDAQGARESSAALAEFMRDEEQPLNLRLLDPRTGAQVEAPVAATALRLLTQALAQMAEGHAVALLPLDTELTTQQAAELLGVSRPYFVKLLEAGRIPFRKVGARRRVRSEDLQRYVAEYQQQAGAELAELAAEAQRLGLYA